MSEVHRYYIVKMLSEDGNRITYDPHGPEVVLASDYEALVQRCRELEGELRKAAFRQQSDESAYSAVAKQNDTLRAEVEILRRDRDACIEVANRNAEDAMSLREDNRHLHQVNLDWADRYVKLERNINALQLENKQLKTLLNGVE